MSGERICAQSLLEQLRGEVRETLSGFEQIGDEELYDCIDQAIVGQAGRQYLPPGSDSQSARPHPHGRCGRTA